MLRAEDLLRQLADGKYHSGEALGHQFSVSRAAIWKVIQNSSRMILRVPGFLP